MSTALATSGAIVFYDIAMRPPREQTCCSPNPWKTRFALNFKRVPYSTTWVSLPDIPKVRGSLGVPACRKFADGTDFCTLPIIEDRTTGAVVGDSFDIAVYLQKTFPDSGAGDLFPPQTLDYEFKGGWILVPLSDYRDKEYPEYAKFNAMVDAVFTTHVQLAAPHLPFDPETEEASRAIFIQRASVQRWEDLILVGEAREKMKESFREALGGLAKLFLRDTSGPFLLGTKASYADLIVGAWLRMMQVTLPKSEWEELRGWEGGIFGRLHDALDVFAEVK
ncbi:hypothetical protein C8Q73DRAFT_404742 [Cubamyces lactineus]|nr:hypothetical protein C8Q73DRAFT_404742 [Cubamyces lactineus]